MAQMRTGRLRVLGLSSLMAPRARRVAQTVALDLREKAVRIKESFHQGLSTCRH